MLYFLIEKCYTTNMNESDIFKHFGGDEDFKMSDFTSADLQEIFEENSKNAKTFKQKYFEFYDDIKSHTKKEPQDW